MTRNAGPRELLRRLIAGGMSMTLLWACNGGTDASPTTAPTTPAPSIAAPTTEATTTTTPSTTAPPTTTTTVAATTTAAPATTIAGTPEEVAKAEVLQTLDAFWTDVDACFAAPDECDKEKVINTYTNADPANPMVEYLNGWVADLRELDQWVAKPEQVTYDLNEVQVVNATLIVTAQCITDSSAMVGRDGAATTILDNETGYSYFRLNWSMSNGQWLIDNGSYGNIEPGTTNPCDF